MTDRLTFREYQELAATTDLVSGDQLEAKMTPLLGLAGEVGSLLSEFKKHMREGDRYRPFADQVAEEIGDVLWYLANIASKAGLDFEDVAQENLAKVTERWPRDETNQMSLLPVGGRWFDDEFPAHERLPRTLRVEFRETQHLGQTTLQMLHDGEPLGDQLTDNSHSQDGYRYHDVFHLTHAIMLGWSPVVRALMRVKRKSAPLIDEVEDGARAAVTEEAISAFVFGYARDHSFFDGVNTVDFELLRTIKTMTQPFEVRACSFRDWESAILAGYRVWRDMIQHRGGVFVGDAECRTVSFEPLAVG